MTGPLEPPRWIEALLVRLLKLRDRETIAGDLLEEYHDAIGAGMSRLRADCQHARQVLSILSAAVFTARHILLAACLFSILASANLVRVSNAPEATPFAIAFVTHSIATIAILNKPRRLPHFITQVGCAVIIWGGSLALTELAWTHFDPKLAVTGITFIFQGFLTVALHMGWFGGFPPRGI